DRLARELEGARRGVRKLTLASAGLAEFLQGPRRYLVFAANNAEMRAGAGSPLSYGLATTRDGNLEMGGMESISSLRQPPPGLPMDPDMTAIWGHLEPNQEWRNVNLTPRFPASAELAARMWASQGGEPVDGVLFLDPFALRAVLRITGPVAVPGGRVSADDVLRDVLHDQYFRPIDLIRRRDRLSDISQATVNALERPLDVARLGQEMLEAVQGRHLLAWSNRPEEQKVWEAAEMDGDLASDSLMVSVLNRGANKLDQFLDVEASLEMREVGDGDGGRAEGTLSVRVRNQSKPDLPAYMLGSYRETEVPPGGYLGILAVNLPGGSEVTDPRGFVRAGQDGRTTVALSTLRLVPGEESVLTLVFRPPRERRAIWVEPSARTPAVAWRAGAQRWTDEKGRAVRL
ncbi:MAG TPA: DUF4012 domain-containing protein, partial [bacterium]|nr:DUF4012 domain-containing protein [bacterium]